jgi:alpha-ribazole phosphatase
MHSTTVWLVRHGEAEGVSNRCCGHADPPLSAQGVAQANAVAGRLAAERISRVYASTSSRAVETAQILAQPHRLPVQPVPDMREIHFGDLEGRTFDEIERRWPDIFQSWMTRPMETHFPNGESFVQMRRRALEALNSLLNRHKNEAIAVVTHAGVIRAVLASALSIPDPEIFRLGQNHGALNRVHYSDNGPVVDLING